MPTPFPGRLALALALFLSPLTSGCAFIANGKRQSVALQSTPQGAQILEGGRVIGTTPTVLRFRRDESHVLTFRLEGYQDVTVDLRRVHGNAVLLNGTNWIGWALDIASGSYYHLTPDDVRVSLTEDDLAQAEASGEDVLHVVLVSAEAVPKRCGLGGERAGAPTPPGGCSR